MSIINAEHTSAVHLSPRGHYQAYSYLPRKTNSHGMVAGRGRRTMQPTARSQPPCICMRAPNCSVYTAAAANYSFQIPYDR